MDQIQNEADLEQPNNPVNPVMNSEPKNTTSKDIPDVEVLNLEHEPICNSQKETDVINNDKSNTSEVVSVLEDDDNVLKDTENNLQPAHSSNNTNMTQAQDEVKIADLYSVVTNVLNELTVENLERLLKQIKALSINNEKRLQGVANLIFEKAVDEPNFSVVGALMCKELALLHVPVNNKSNTNKEQQCVSFRTLLVKQCQIEFEKNSVIENERNLKLKEIDKCTDSEKKKELQLLLEEDHRKMRMKSVGVVRFIGELFQQQMLTVRAMLNFINILLENNNRNEDNLECLCTLLTTVGEHRELSKNQNLQPYIVKIQQIIDTDHGNISSRVRLMLQNVIEFGKTAELNKIVTNVFNERNPNNSERHLNQIRTQSIDNEERLQGVIDLVFEKAVDGPNYSVVGALVCKELALIKVPNNPNKEEQQFVNFRQLLITKCQIEFEKNLADENARNLKIKEIDEYTNPEKKKEFKLLLEEDDRRMRIKSVGIITFIGELFKQKMLTAMVILNYIKMLLEKKDEYSLECLCKLLTTVGKDLDHLNLRSYFLIMQEIVDEKHGKISNRVRFMLQDVIKNSKWKPKVHTYFPYGKYGSS